ncbi:uncharacterized protein QO010_001556 [Caulobacter ginsengisoli]|uniref:DUF418 domain-containing protein n=1 Tax=Caulobacter ginsengisoli TaxID=400775 RepID=A0ABU0IQV6_9CAUL|nr:DUF418 domain-containing protein [Caulobacter ginsengisoli]MDQ0463785.1 uncharacterized protein [Caulobacter ginsengisoli]
MTATAPTGDRYLSIDAVRGFAVLGILLMNITGMAGPTFGYIDPTYAGGTTPADLWTWAVNHVLTDGKMRGLFTMLFGASTVLIADRAEQGRIQQGGGLGPVATHYRRMFWLLVIGMLHAYFLWWGDILVCYAVAGLLVFPFRKLDPKLLVALGALILVLVVAHNVYGANQMRALSDAIASGTATPAMTAEWNQAQLLISPPASMGDGEIRLFRGGFMEALQARAYVAVLMQLFVEPPDGFPEAIGQMLIGMALFKSGFFTLKWSTKAYATAMAVGYLIAVPVTAWITWEIWDNGFDPLLRMNLDAWGAIPRPFIAIAHGSALLLLVRSGALSWLIDRFAAAGRMAFSNYLMTSIITTFLFCGFGLGLYGHLSRFEQLYVVGGIWVFILVWSKPWLERFQYGPFEWVWRSLVQWKPQPFVRRPPPPGSQGPASAEPAG